MSEKGSDHFDVVSVGEILVDFVAPEAEDLPSAGAFIRAAGGAPANVVVAAARLGGSAAFVGAVGRDAFGEYLRATLEQNGVATAGLQAVAERTTLAFVARNAGGIPDFLFYRGADAALRPEDLPWDILSRSAFVHVSSMALLSEPSRSATLTAVEMAHHAGALVSVDPNLRPSSWSSTDAIRRAVDPILRAADVLKVNDEEARLLTGTADIDEAIEKLDNGRRLIAVTLGAEGCRWRWQGETGSAAAPTVEVVETTGAGDAFVGALLAGLCASGYTAGRFPDLPVSELTTIVQFACIAGALACTQPGAMTSLPRREQVEALLVR